MTMSSQELAGGKRNVFDEFAAIVYPPRCALTGELIDVGDFSRRALDELLTGTDRPRCARCGADVGPHLDHLGDCDLCRDERYAFRGVTRLGLYHGSLALACRLLKHHRGHRLAHALAELLWEHRQRELIATSPDLVVPVPLHWQTEWFRGYNPSAVLAGVLGRRLGRPVYSHAVRRIRRTRPQHHLSPTERRTNVRGAFRPRRRLKGARVLLVDDVFTTGSTCHHVAKALLDGGAESVHVAVLARGGSRVGPAV